MESLSFVDDHSSISIKDSPLTVFSPKTLLESLSNAIEVFRVNGCSDLEVVITEDKFMIVSWKKDCSILFSSDFKIKGRISVVEVYSWVRNWETKVPQRIDREDTILRDLEPFGVGVCDFESKVIEGESMESEDEFFGDGAGRFDVVVIFTSVLKVKCDGGDVFGWAWSSIVCDSNRGQD